MEEQKTVNLFVYGSLLTDESKYMYLKPFVTNIKSGRVYGNLYSGVLFATVVLNPEGMVYGKWLSIQERALGVVDGIEGYSAAGEDNCYEREWVKDVSGETEGWIYVWNDSKGLTHIEGGSWENRPSWPLI